MYGLRPAPTSSFDADAGRGKVQTVKLQTQLRAILELAQFKEYRADAWVEQLEATEHNRPRGDHPYQCEIRSVPGGELIGLARASDRTEAEERAHILAAAPALLAECKRQREQIAALREALELIDHTSISGLDGDEAAACADIGEIARSALKVSP